MVPLAEAWDSGASAWDTDRRMRYANGLSADATGPVRQCTYLADWAATKLRWGLTAEDKERAALETCAKDCPGTVVKYEPAS